MKKITSFVLAFVLILPLVFIASCGNNYDYAPSEGVWESATFGSGEKTFTFEIVTEDKSVTHTIKTDKKTVGEALSEVGLIEGEEGAFGIYIKVVNGVVADYDVDKTYWAFYINGEKANTGADMTDIEDNATYKLSKEK